MLFSNPEVAKFVGENFVAAWEGLRPVPIVEIDFGNGRKIKRTVNGNIATYMCTPDGRVVDVIPGLNTPKAYLDDLRYALNLYRASLAKFDATILDYHRANLSEPTVYVWVLNDMSKSGIERLVRMSLDKKRQLEEQTAGKRLVGERIVPGPYARPVPDRKKREVEATVRALSSEDVALLTADTEFNRKERRPIVHKILAEKIVQAPEITKRIYKDVLHCNLDDPYLGLVTEAFNGGAYENR